MMSLCYDVLHALKGFTLATAESCTGGGIGKALTDIAGSSEVYKGGVISYTNFVKECVLGVDPAVLSRDGAVSARVAEQMATGARRLLHTDWAVSVTGLAGPGGDEYGNSVGTVFIGISSESTTMVKEYHFEGNRRDVRNQSVSAALTLLLECIKKEPTV